MWQIADTFADQQINPAGYRMIQKESSFSGFSILVIKRGLLDNPPFGSKIFRF